VGCVLRLIDTPPSNPASHIAIWISVIRQNCKNPFSCHVLVSVADQRKWLIHIMIGRTISSLNTLAVHESGFSNPAEAWGVLARAAPDP
jgi:hypothetical protein